ncbi:PI-PLC X-box domain-containing protein DDB_G0293730 [Trichonephila inaurata madagascariensis]|uniref:PI-PLC X-box domain-containing protein DDB_G0293730 n=1 Tax=Trichonephila inaurata madagascariensis TaxID=2747483 RepID=A0A8X6WZ81_9ARAC|nr:PI-PLC X-box domain-containing protein DDB_G0293730 [Trichonephila inaurata madagascariensis]
MLHTNLIIITCVVFISSTIVSSSIIHSLKDCYENIQPRTEIFLTIASLYSLHKKNSEVQRWLEVNWVTEYLLKDDSIDVYNKDPTLDPTIRPLLTLKPKEHPKGYFRTKIKVPIISSFLNPEEKNTCRDYWATYRNAKGKVESSTCLKIHPLWMEHISKRISSLRLHELMIPGSHDSGCFSTKNKKIPFLRYKLTQEVSIFNQLVYGLRYFDLRIGYYEETYDKYFINHNSFKTSHSVMSVLDQVRSFLQKAKKEIVILDFHKFPYGFDTDETHQKLLALIQSILGPLLLPYDFRNATLHEIWQSGKNVIVSYEYKFRNGTPAYLWPRIPRAWGNKQDLESLRTYFQEVFSKPTPKGLWAAMAEMTPNLGMIILNPLHGLRPMADEVNREVSRWFRDLYWQKTNIIATDYFLGNDIINIAIRANQIKGVCPRRFWSHLKI